MDDLTARAAWRGGRFGRRIDDHASQTNRLFAGNDGVGNRGAFGAIAKSEGGVLDVAAGEGFTRCGQNRGTDSKLRVGCIGAAGRFFCQTFKFS